jgi:hypothetical protein
MFRVPVEAFGSSVFAGTVVVNEKLASDPFTRPDPLSLAVQAILTSVTCQTPSALPQLIVGGVPSDGGEEPVCTSCMTATVCAEICVTYARAVFAFAPTKVGPPESGNVVTAFVAPSIMETV